MDQKIGVYICTGCGIGESIDPEALSSVANDEFSVAKCVTHEALCGEEGIGILRQDVESGEVNCLVVAACSARAKTDVFSFDPAGTILERVNLREHVAWQEH